MRKIIVSIGVLLLPALVGCSAPADNDAPPQEEISNSPAPTVEAKTDKPAKPRRKMTLDTVANRHNLPQTIKDRIDIIRHEDIDGTDENGPKVGKEAPDFDLTPLRFYDFGVDETEITEENAGELYKPVKLSDFRNKKPVVLIFGSYT